MVQSQQHEQSCEKKLSERVQPSQLETLFANSGQPKSEVPKYEDFENFS
jgi:hypothetical protein